jgi:hypothetical protein
MTMFTVITLYWQEILCLHYVKTKILVHI